MYHDEEEEQGFGGIMDLDETAEDFDGDSFPGGILDDELPEDDDEPLNIGTKLADDEESEEMEELE